MSNEFTPDAKLQELAEAFAQEAVCFAAKHLNITLDYSDRSIAFVESILGEFHRGIAAAVPPAEQIQRYSQWFGSYLGETFRRNHSATWGSTASGGSKIPSMRSERTTTVFFPWTRAYNRITKGDTEGITAYYQYLLDELGGTPQPPPILTPPPVLEKRSLFGRLFGK